MKNLTKKDRGYWINALIVNLVILATYFILDYLYNIGVIHFKSFLTIIYFFIIPLLLILFYLNYILNLKDKIIFSIVSLGTVYASILYSFVIKPFDEIWPNLILIMNPAFSYIIAIILLAYGLVAINLFINRFRKEAKTTKKDYSENRRTKTFLHTFIHIVLSIIIISLILTTSGNYNNFSKNMVWLYFLILSAYLILGILFDFIIRFIANKGLYKLKVLLRAIFILIAIISTIQISSYAWIITRYGLF